MLGLCYWQPYRHSLGSQDPIYASSLTRSNMKLETIHDTVAVTPPAGVVAASAAGVPIATWVLWLNLFYILLAVGWKMRTIYKESRNGSK